MNPNQVRFATARSVVVTILRRACEDCPHRILGSALVDCVYRGDELLDGVSLVHATPLGNSYNSVLCRILFSIDKNDVRTASLIC
jgi:hypothetical protein